jgi:hypothetical protein
MPNVDLSRVPAYYHGYISQVKPGELEAAFQVHRTELYELLKSIPESKWDYRYAEGKWSIREVVQHIIDAERIFCYRALRFARKDETPLPGFDENIYVDNSDAGRRSKDELLEELLAVQLSSSHLFKSFTNEQLEQAGTANGKSIYVKGIGFIIVGHALHHKNILVERYLEPAVAM